MLGMDQTITTRISIGLITAAALLLGGCEGAGKAIGMGKQAPDEFNVLTRAPLSMPPDFGLRPPRPGVERPQERETVRSARDLIVKSPNQNVLSRNVSPSSPGESAILSKAGATNPDPNIRQQINRESSILATNDESFANKLIFWKGQSELGTVVDAQAERKRLRENAALGAPPTRGRTPEIIRKPGGWLKGLVN
ncbi:MAG: hypothetical protein CFH41_01862 [Alphaproteobacteria bacterium MarineAlpha11_Bin1]|nr:MAG: hypothetical protein CFH41_01862 [Alphaproteobacteria bacterium MarineAlpha11_Bin1]|tara:strand:+ start:12834 stop:13418 length:585 start_codon:yes stop_codon:yes gene_type:complete